MWSLSWKMGTSLTEFNMKNTKTELIVHVVLDAFSYLYSYLGY